MKPPLPDPSQPVAGTDLEVDEPAAFSLRSFSFNFTVDAAAQVAGRMGAPAFALRRQRIDRRLEAFWAEVEGRRNALWIAAREGRVDDEGAELRPALLNADGRDRFAHLDQRKKLFRDRADEDQSQRQLFELAWQRYLKQLEFDSLAAEIDEYNKYFPIEANLATDPESGRFVWMGRDWQPLVAPDIDAVMKRFTTD